MEGFAGYDGWLASPYTDQVEPPECGSCGDWMSVEVDGDEDGAYLVSWCENPLCDETE
jgi:hypothetical protein